MLFLIAGCDPDRNDNILPAGDNGYMATIREHNPYDTTEIEETASALFYTSPASATHGIDAGPVHLNDALLVIDNPATGQYTLFDYVHLKDSVSWLIQGNASVPGFSYRCPRPYPDYAGSIPDTISKSVGVIFHYTASNADSVLFVFDYMSNHEMSKYIPAATGTATFTPQDLAGLTANVSTFLEVSALSFERSQNAGKSYSYANDNRRLRFVYVKP